MSNLPILATSMTKCAEIVFAYLKHELEHYPADAVAKISTFVKGNEVHTQETVWDKFSGQNIVNDHEKALVPSYVKKVSNEAVYILYRKPDGQYIEDLVCKEDFHEGLFHHYSPKEPDLEYPDDYWHLINDIPPKSEACSGAGFMNLTN